MMSERLQQLSQRINSACERSGRSPSSVRLLSVSKGHDLSKISEAYDLGLRDFGENYTTELKAKQSHLQSQCPDICWHYLGGIQSNKLRIISTAAWVHTLSEWHHAQALSNLLSPAQTINVLLQVNLSKEKHRSGVFPEHVLERYEKMRKLPGLNLCGLMTIAPISESASPHFWFKRMLELKNELESKIGEAVPELSMGMSMDFEEAIQFGATWIRIGTLLFGDRE